MPRVLRPPNERVYRRRAVATIWARLGVILTGLCQTGTMTGYVQFCPVAKGAKVFAERWTPLLLRELLCGSHHFSELMQGLPRMSQSLLVQRLQSLEQAGIVQRRPLPSGRGFEYLLTDAGMEFAQVVEHLGEWGQRWAVDNLGPDDLDAGHLLWSMHRDVDVCRIPDRRVVIQFDFRGLPHEWYRYILNRPNVEVCLRDYGFEVDLFVMADLMALTQVHLGRLHMLQALKDGLVEIHGPVELRRAFPTWIGTNHFAHYTRPLSITEVASEYKPT